MSSTSDPLNAPTRRDISKSLSATKNLRAISMSLVNKLRVSSGVSSVEIATELATEAVSEVEGSALGVTEEELQAVGKNIRRRLYDSLKVLESIGAIVRTRKNKTLTWVGTHHLIPPRFQVEQSVGVQKCCPEQAALSQSVQQLRKGISAKATELSQLKEQARALLNLYRRNRHCPGPKPVRIHMPFVVIRTPVSTEIKLNATPDAHSIAFEFHGYYEIVNDASILDRMFLVGNPTSGANWAQAAHTKAISRSWDSQRISSDPHQRADGDPFSSPKRSRIASRSPFAKFTSGSKPPLSPGTPLWQDAMSRKRVALHSPLLGSNPCTPTTPTSGLEYRSEVESPTRDLLSAPPRKRRFDYGIGNNECAPKQGDSGAGFKKGFLRRRTYGLMPDRASPEKGNIGHEHLTDASAAEAWTS